MFKERYSEYRPTTKEMMKIVAMDAYGPMRASIESLINLAGPGEKEIRSQLVYGLNEVAKEIEAVAEAESEFGKSGMKLTHPEQQAFFKTFAKKNLMDMLKSQENYRRADGTLLPEDVINRFVNAAEALLEEKQPV